MSDEEEGIVPELIDHRKFLPAVDPGPPAPSHNRPWFVEFPEKREALMTLLKAGNPLNTAVQFAGVPLSSFYYAMRVGRNTPEGPYAEFVEEVLQAQAVPKVRWQRTIDRAAQNDWKAAFALLERRDPENYGKRDKVVVGGDPNNPVVVELRWPTQNGNIIDLDDDDIEELDAP